MTDQSKVLTAEIAEQFLANKYSVDLTKFTEIEDAAAESLNLQHDQPSPIVMGRHLIALGHSPGPSFKKILDQCFEAQLDGAFTCEEQALVFLHQLLRDREHECS